MKRIVRTRFDLQEGGEDIVILRLYWNKDQGSGTTMTCTCDALRVEDKLYPRRAIYVRPNLSNTMCKESGLSLTRISFDIRSIVCAALKSHLHGVARSMLHAESSTCAWNDTV